MILGKTDGVPWKVWQFVDSKAKQALSSWLLDEPLANVYARLKEVSPEDLMTLHLCACLSQPFELDTICMLKTRIGIVKKMVSTKSSQHQKSASAKKASVPTTS